MDLHYLKKTTLIQVPSLNKDLISISIDYKRHVHSKFGEYDLMTTHIHMHANDAVKRTSILEINSLLR